MEKSRRLDSAERWLRDGLEVNRPPAFFQVVDVDMTRARNLIRAAEQTGIRITYTHLVVRAAALALAANLDIHQVVCGGRVRSPDRVDIALSVAGEAFVSPTLVLEAADRKKLPAISREIAERAPAIREADRKMLKALRRWGWIVPLPAIRRGILRALFRSESFRRKGSGTFQVSILQGVDYFIAPMFSACGILNAGRVRDLVKVVEGKIAVRPILTLTCSGDHRIWDGRAGERLLLAVRNILESGELESDFGGLGFRTAVPPEVLVNQSD